MTQADVVTAPTNPLDSEGDRLSAALAIVAQDFPVAPAHSMNGGCCTCGKTDCSSPAKHPRTSHGFKDATCDPDQIASWWGKWPDANIMLATGAVAGFWALDIDPKSGGAESFAELEKTHGKLPSTVEVMTGGGGRHLYFHQPGGKIAISAGKLGDGLDVRGDGGYVIAPPSNHASGGTYRWYSGRALGDLKVANAPDWLLDLVRTPAKSAGARVRPVDARPAVSSERGLTELQRAAKRIAQAEPGRQECTLNDEAYRIGTLIGRGENDFRQACAALVAAGLKMSNDPNKEPWTRREIAMKVSRALRDGHREGGTRSTRGTPNLAATESTEPSGKLDSVLASDVTVREVEWFWPQRIAYGTITIIDGDPGTGKSTISLDLAARLSVGTELPGGGECDAAGVVVLTSEDAFGSTVVPRLKAAGANLDNINLVRGVKGSHGETELISIPENVAVLRDAIHSVTARLVVIDPLIAFISLQAHAHNDQQIRRALAPLARLAEETGVAVLALRHLTKKPGTPALYRGGGSIGLIGAARTGLIVGKDPYDKSCRVLAMTKSNLGVCAPSLRYRIVGQSSSPGEEPWEASAVEWVGLSAVSADQLVAVSGEDKGGAMKDAVMFLKEVLKGGPMMAKEVLSLAKEDDHSKSTLNRAAKEISVVKSQVHDGKKIVGWEWSLPLNAVPGVLVDEDAASESLQVESQHVH